MIFVYWNKEEDICVKETDGEHAVTRIYVNSGGDYHMFGLYPEPLLIKVLLEIEPKLGDQQLFIVDNNEYGGFNYSIYDDPALSDFLFLHRRRLTVFRMYLPSEQVMYLINWYEENMNNLPFT